MLILLAMNLATKTRDSSWPDRQLRNVPITTPGHWVGYYNEDDADRDLAVNHIR